MLSLPEFGELQVDDVTVVFIAWTPHIVLLLGAIGTIITVRAQASKTRAETDMIKEQQEQLHIGQKNIQAQFVNNGGSTMKDSIDDIRKELSVIRSEMGRLSEVDILDRTYATKEHERFYMEIKDLQSELIGHIKEVPDKLKTHQEDTVKMIEGKLPCI